MKSKIKHIFSDIDNSLLYNYEISNANLNALKEIHKKYPKITLNLLTARNYNKCFKLKKLLLKQLSFFPKIKVYSDYGAKIIKINSKKLTKEEFQNYKFDISDTNFIKDVTKEGIVKLYELLKNDSGVINIHYKEIDKKPKGIIYENEFSSDFFPTGDIKKELLKEDLKTMLKISSAFSLEKKDMLEDIKSEFEKHNLYFEIYYNRNYNDAFSRRYNYVEITPITKLQTFKKIEENTKNLPKDKRVTKENSIFVGDDCSDVKLLRYIDNPVFVEANEHKVKKEDVFDTKEKLKKMKDFNHAKANQQKKLWKTHVSKLIDSKKIEKNIFLKFLVNN